MTVVWAVLAVLLLLDGLRLRARVRRLVAIAPDGAADRAEPSNDDFVLLRVVGLDVPGRVLRAACVHARRHQLELVDLVPDGSAALDVMGLCQLVDPGTWGKDRLASGRTAAGQALLVSRHVLERAGVSSSEPIDPERFVRVASRLKRYAATTAAMVSVPDMPSARIPLRSRRAVLEALVGRAAPIVLSIQAAILGALFAVALRWQPWGALPLAAYWLQPALALGGTRRVRNVSWIGATLLRPLLEVGRIAAAALGPSSTETATAVAERRPKYERLLAGGTERFFEPRSERCPLCGGSSLSVLVSTPDLVQHKPGRFTLERCAGCGHVFQNPRLSLEGLSFYYGDAYDGLGEESTEMLFAASPRAYLERARLVREVAEPTRWLDVGCGHGHFSATAVDVLGPVEMDGLDLSDSVEDAARRGWIRRAYRGLFPELAPSMAGHYDVVSMHHYLEHTRDPAAEIRAAAIALAPGGHLSIELPDPQSILGSLLGRFWLPYFQPQHLHLLSIDNLRRILEREGFEIVRLQRGESHIPVDFLGAAMLALGAIAPPNDVPWRPRGGPLRRAWSKVVWTLGLPVLVAARALDRVLLVVTRRPGVSNAFRVVAALRASAAAPASDRAPLAAE